MIVCVSDVMHDGVSLVGGLCLYYTISARDLHALPAFVFVVLLLPINSDCASSASPRDQVSSVLEVAFPIETGDRLEYSELFFALLLGHDISCGYTSIIYQPAKDCTTSLPSSVIAN